MTTGGIGSSGERTRRTEVETGGGRVRTVTEERSLVPWGTGSTERRVLPRRHVVLRRRSHDPHPLRCSTGTVQEDNESSFTYVYNENVTLFVPI